MIKDKTIIFLGPIRFNKTKNNTLFEYEYQKQSLEKIINSSKSPLWNSSHSSWYFWVEVPI